MTASTLASPLSWRPNAVASAPTSSASLKMSVSTISGTGAAAARAAPAAEAGGVARQPRRSVGRQPEARRDRKRPAGLGLLAAGGRVLMPAVGLSRARLVAGEHLEHDVGADRGVGLLPALGHRAPIVGV